MDNELLTKMFIYIFKNLNLLENGNQNEFKVLGYVS